MKAWFGVCPLCKNQQDQQTSGKQEPNDDCLGCYEGTVELFENSLDRDIRVLELRHDVKITFTAVPIEQD